MKELAQVAQALAAPFQEHEIGFRPVSTTQDKKSGQVVAYVSRNAIMNRLDQVAGVDGWSTSIQHLGPGAVLYRLEVLGTIKEAMGAAGTDAAQRDKAADTDGLKRAAAMFGIGRYLKDVDLGWVQLEQRGKSHVIPQAARAILLRKLAAATGASTSPAAAAERPATAAVVPIASAPSAAAAAAATSPAPATKSADLVDLQSQLQDLVTKLRLDADDQRVLAVRVSGKVTNRLDRLDVDATKRAIAELHEVATA